MKKFVALAFLAASLVGCASVNMGDAGQDAAAKSFTASAGKAAVYVYRNESIGAAVKMDVEIDGSAVGQTAAQTFTWQVEDLRRLAQAHRCRPEQQ